MSRFVVRASRAVALALLPLLLLSCTVVVEEEHYRPGPRPQYCTREYEPVCARRGNDRRTFANACRAETSGFRVIRYGECRRGGGFEESPRFCTREYAPVCATSGNIIDTFDNACEARRAGFRVVGEGRC